MNCKSSRHCAVESWRFSRGAAHAIDAHRIQAYAARSLPEAQAAALQLWLLGYGHDEIAAERGLAGATVAPSTWCALPSRSCVAGS